MPHPQSSTNRVTSTRPEQADPFAMQLALSRVHARLVPMQRDQQGYSIDPSAEGWFALPSGRGFAGYGLGRALRMLLDVLRGLTALHDTFDTQGENFAHGEVALTQFRVDSEGVCRLVPLTSRHSAAESTPPTEALGHLAPERLLGERVDARADVFSAGVLLWEALAGRRLFSETTGDAIIDRLMGEKLQMPQLPPELAWAIPLKSIAARALAVDPYQRFADCAELATAIAIVARERVATHAEIAAFFGAKVRSLASVAQPRPVPTRSSTFPSVSLPVTPSPPSVSAPPTSRNGFPLATPGPRSVTPPAMPAASVPDSSRSAAHKSPSPFTALLSAEARLTAAEVPPASQQRRKTLTSVGTPLAVLAPVETEHDNATAVPSWKSPPPMPVWAPQAASTPAPAAQSSSSVVVFRSTLDSIPLSADEVATFRRWTPRRTLLAVALVALTGVIALFAFDGSEPPAKSVSEPSSGRALIATPSNAASEPAAPSADEPRGATAPASGTDMNSAPVAAPKDPRPASKAAPATKRVSADSPKDYGI